MLDKIRTILRTATAKPTSAPTPAARRPATLAAEIKTFNESFQYGNGGISVQLRLSADRQAEFESKLNEIKLARDTNIDLAQRTCDEVCKNANAARNAAVSAETDAFAHALRNLFLVFGRAAPVPPKVKDDKELSIPSSKQKPSEIIARARRQSRAENGGPPPVPFGGESTAGFPGHPTLQVSKPEPMKALTDETA